MKRFIIAYLLTLGVFFTPSYSKAATIGVNQPIISLTSIPVTFTNIRPDIAGAVGTGNDVCVATNDNLKSSTKTGQPGAYDTFADELALFFYSLDNKTSNAALTLATQDPQLLFDPFTNRWFYTSLTMISVSDGPQLKNARWQRFQYTPYLINPVGDPAVVEGPDYDQTGIDQHALIMGFASIGGTPFVTVFQKASLVSGGPLIATKFRVPRMPGGLLTLTNPVGVTNFDANPPFSYAIATGSNVVNKLNIYRFANSATPNPTLSTITVNLPDTADVFYPYVCKPGSFNQIPQPYDVYACLGPTAVGAPLNGRVMSPAHIRDNQLYFCHNVTTNDPVVTGADAIRWYQIDLTDPDNPCVVQFGSITVPDQMMPLYGTNNFYYPTLMTNTVSRIVPSSESGCPNDVPTHNMVIGFSAGRPNGLVQTVGFLYIYGFLPTTGEFYNAATTNRLATDPLGQTGPITFLTNSQNGIIQEYYGDYSSSALDPADGKTIWQFAMQCDAQSSYAIQSTQILN